MILRQLLHHHPVIAASYVFGWGGKSQGAVCDPIHDVELYLRTAEESGLQIRYVIDTHLHADHLSGGRELAERTGAQYVLHESARTRYTFRGVTEGDVLDLGNVSIQMPHTPGHTPEHIIMLSSPDLRISRRVSPHCEGLFRRYPARKRSWFIAAAAQWRIARICGPYRLLKELGFERLGVLDLPTNFRTDWVAKGYPVETWWSARKRIPILNFMAESIPLLRHRHFSPSAFTPEALVRAVRAERGIGPKSVPGICVLDFDGDLTDWVNAKGLARPCASWACFHTTMNMVKVDGIDCGIIPRTIGGSYAVLVAEQLRVSGAELIVGLTSAGRVLDSLPLPSLVFVAHYHLERNHQGLQNRLIIPDPRVFRIQRGLKRRQRLGGLLNYYRVAA
jgi:hypothetical protein